MSTHWPKWLLSAGLAVATALSGAASSTNTITWSTHRVDADVRNMELREVLETVAHKTGWQIFAEPGLEHVASVRFRGFTPGAALRSLLGNLNYALVPQTNGLVRLFVFRTGLQNATAEILARTPAAEAERGTRVPNELIVRFKSRADAERWAALLGAKITGSIPELDAYRLEFTDAEAAGRAKEQMAGNSEVLAIDYNYYVDQPPPASEMTSNVNRPLSLKPKPAGESGRVVVGLIDTGLNPVSSELQAFVLKQISVAGESVLDPNSPSHADSMLQTILRSLETVTKGSSSTVILPVDVYGASTTSSTWNVAAGIVQAVNNGANVLNLSLGGNADSAMLRDLIARLNKQGIPIYAAAGNEPVATPFYPAAYPEVTAVTALAGPASATQPASIAAYANYGSFVDIAAPDANIVYFGRRQYFIRGTSAATAYTSGLAAGLFETSRQNWNAINAEIRKTFAVPASGVKP